MLWLLLLRESGWLVMRSPTTRRCDSESMFRNWAAFRQRWQIPDLIKGSPVASNDNQEIRQTGLIFYLVFYLVHPISPSSFLWPIQCGQPQHLLLEALGLLGRGWCLHIPCFTFLSSSLLSWDYDVQHQVAPHELHLFFYQLSGCLHADYASIVGELTLVIRPHSIHWQAVDQTAIQRPFYFLFP